jgi:uncharacterized membrane protein
MDDETTLGLDANIEGSLCYVLGWITGIIFVLLEKKNEFVRFHAMQSLVTFLGLNVLGYVIRVIPLIGGMLSSLVWVVELILWVVLIIKAYQGERFKLPVVGDFAEKQLGVVGGS